MTAKFKFERTQDKPVKYRENTLNMNTDYDYYPAPDELRDFYLNESTSFPGHELDETESCCQWFDERGFPVAGANPNGGEVVSVFIPRSLPLQLDYPVWRLSFSAYAAYKGWEMP